MWRKLHRPPIHETHADSALGLRGDEVDVLVEHEACELAPVRQQRERELCPDTGPGVSRWNTNLPSVGPSDLSPRTLQDTALNLQFKIFGNCLLL